MKAKNILIVAVLLALGLAAYVVVSDRGAENTANNTANEQTAVSPSFYMVPSKSKLKAGEEFSVDVMLNTNGQKVVAVSAYLTFDPAKFEVVTVDGQTSPFTIEVEKNVVPKDENSNVSKVLLTRGQPTPGVTGDKILVSRVNFRALAAGTTEMGFDLAAPKEGPSRIILDDGLGTDILAGVATIKYSIQ